MTRMTHHLFWPLMRAWIGRAPAVVALCGLLALGACKPRRGDLDGPLTAERAAQMAKDLRAHLKRHPEDKDAWRDLAHLEWLHLARPEEADPILARLAGQDDPVARAGRMIRAHNRLDPKTAQAEAYGILKWAASDSGPLAAPLGELAARLLRRQMGEVPGDEDAFVAFFDGLDLTRLPQTVRQPLQSERASLARRRGDDYIPYYTEQGCVRSWRVGVLEGHLGVVELGRREGDPFQVDPEAEAVALSCAVRVWNPHPRSGIRRVSTALDVGDAGLVLEIRSEFPVRAYLDGKRIHATDGTDRWQPRRTYLDVQAAPGQHELTLSTPIPNEHAWVMVRATDTKARPISSKAVAVASPAGVKGFKARRSPWPKAVDPRIAGSIYAPLRAWLALEHALAVGDTDRAEGHATRLAKAERFGDGQALVAIFERDDPSRGVQVSGTRERAALERALSVDPGLERPRLRLLTLALRKGEEDEVLETLKRLPEGQLRGVQGELFRHRLQMSRGSTHLAEQALARAADVHGDHCGVLMAQRAMARRDDRVADIDTLTEKLTRCGGSLTLRARLARQRGNLEEATRLWETLLARSPDDVDSLGALADLAAAQGEDGKAKDYLERLLHYAPYRVDAEIGIADLLLRAGKHGEARARVERALNRVPQSNILRALADDLGVPDALLEHRVDGRKAIEAYRAADKETPGVTEELVLDRSVTWVYPNGGQRQLIHMVVHLLSKEALDRYGELGVPGGATLLTLHSIKPDGTRVEPESIAGKDGLSLRHLEQGDMVEMEYIVEHDPMDLVPGAVGESAFRFRSFDVPYHHSELVLVHPKGMSLGIEPRNGAPEMKVREDGDRVIRSWLARNVTRMGVEPGARDTLDELPIVRVGTPVDVNAFADTIAVRLRGTQRTNPALRQQTKRLIAKAETPRARLQTLWRWVVQNVESGGDLSTLPTATLAARRGNRLMLLHAMLREAGLRSELWLARNAFGPKEFPQGLPLLEVFDTPLLAVYLDDGAPPVPVMTGSRVLPLGYLAAPFSGAEAIRVQLDPDGEASGRVTMPRSPQGLADRRIYDLQIDLDGTGRATLEGSLELGGMEALAWRQTLEQIDRDRIEEVFQQAELPRFLSGGTLTSLELENETDLDKPLVLRFTASTDRFGVSQGGATVLPAGLVPMNFGKGYTSLPRRQTGMAIGYGPVQRATIRLRIAGAKVAQKPKDAAIESRFGAFTREVQVDDGGKTLVMKLESVLRPGLVGPDEYPQLLGLTTAIEAAEQDVIAIR